MAKTYGPKRRLGPTSDELGCWASVHRKAPRFSVVYDSSRYRIDVVEAASPGGHRSSAFSPRSPLTTLELTSAPTDAFGHWRSPGQR